MLVEEDVLAAVAADVSGPAEPGAVAGDESIDAGDPGEESGEEPCGEKDGGE